MERLSAVFCGLIVPVTTAPHEAECRAPVARAHCPLKGHNGLTVRGWPAALRKSAVYKTSAAPRGRVVIEQPDQFCFCAADSEVPDDLDDENPDDDPPPEEPELPE